MMASGHCNDGSVLPHSAQDVLNLFIDGDYILKEKKDIKGSRAWQQFRNVLVLWRPTRIVFYPMNTECWMKTQSVQSHTLLCVKHTLQKKLTCLQQVSLYSTGSYPGQIQVWPGLLSGSVGHPGQQYWPGFNPDGYVAQGRNRVSTTDPDNY